MQVLSQTAIAFLGATAIFLSQSDNAKTRRFACFFGLAGQPFWFYSAVAAQQWGIVLLCAFYTVAWARGIRTHWLSGQPSAEEILEEEHRRQREMRGRAAPQAIAAPTAAPIYPGDTMSTDEQVEQEIQNKGLTAPRVTPADIEAEIASENYFTALDGVLTGAPIDSATADPLSRLTFCVLVLKNGFTVVGKSACASPENFDAAIGRKIARQDAIDQMWPLLGFRLRDQLTRGPMVRERTLTDEELQELAAQPGVIVAGVIVADPAASAVSAVSLGSSAGYDCNAGHDSGSCGGVD